MSVTLTNVAPYVGAWIETVARSRWLCRHSSHPTWVRGLKLKYADELDSAVKSHPTWVRGLKLRCHVTMCVEREVAPYVGAWIETRHEQPRPERHQVAPYVGAWIETSFIVFLTSLSTSHPTWVRGLKPFLVDQAKETLKSHPTWVRGLKQSVYKLYQVTNKSHPTWVRGLKP